MAAIPRGALRSIRHSTVCLAGALMLAGCAAQPIGSFARPEFTAEAAQAHHDLYFLPGRPDLAGGETARLDHFLQSLVLRPEDDIVLEFGTTGSDVLDRQRLATVHRTLAPYPARSRILARGGFSSPEPRPDAAMVQVLRYDRLRVECQNSGRTRGDLLYLSALPPIGCANAANLAHMAASPRDLTAPRRLSASEAGTSAAAVGRHRSGEVKFTPLSVGAGN